MYVPRRKCFKLLTWISFAIAAQVIFSLLLHVEFNLAPIDHDSATMRGANRITSRERLQSQNKNVEHVQMEENLKFIAIGRVKLDDARGKGSSIDYKGNVIMKSTKLPMTGRNFRNPLQLIGRNNESISLSSAVITQEEGGHKSAYSPVGHEITKDYVLETEFTELKDIFISVKTTGDFHRTRVETLQQTWFQNAPDQIFFFTDLEDAKVNESLRGHLIKTTCQAGHQRAKLCCKMQAEINFFLQKMKTKWFCHFDDDNYVNVPALVKTLRNLNSNKDVYIGKPSLVKEMEAWDRLDENKKKKFWFATGGAGFCLSRALINKMIPYVSDGKFEESCERVRLPDDCTMGFISEVLLAVKLTKSELFHSHLEALSLLGENEFSEQISFSHGILGGHDNRIGISGPFDIKDDPSRFKSVHCFLYPGTSWCPKSEK